MAETFTYLLDYPADLERQPAILEAKFGDGYVQRVGDGLNNNLEVWKLQASGIPMEIGEAIDIFLSARGGHELFNWTAPTPNAIVKSYICKQWKVTYNDEDEASFSATFEEDVLPAEII